jgi:outer membrane protein OmpA-like peptidoglycan-associated protein
VRKDTEWMSISDIMSGLMMVFLFITVSLLVNHDDEKKEKQKALLEIAELQSDHLTKNELKNLIFELQTLVNELVFKNKQLNLKIENLQDNKTQLNREIRLLKIEIANLKRQIPKSNNAARDKAIKDINQMLQSEFNDDLKKWGASIDANNSIVFKHPKIYFDSASSEISPEFKNILDQFFPKYIKLFSESNLSDYIKNIKIEGHTSSVWNFNRITKPQDQYFNHMELSQERSNSVLKYCYSNLPHYDSFLKSKLESSGLSFSQAITKTNKKEDSNSSHRVTFRLTYK